jgi:glycerol-3-phosphate dehydrogenase
MEAHAVDLLIIGAGIQGAWLLREALKRNLNAIVIGKLDHAGTPQILLIMRR